ncbi:MAG: hypothetical protein E5X77_37645, partial [Mesorhizobium sp.]
MCSAHCLQPLLERGKKSPIELDVPTMREASAVTVARMFFTQCCSSCSNLSWLRSASLWLDMSTRVAMAPRTLPVGIFIAEDGNGAEIRANRRAVELMGQHSTGDKLISVPAILPLTLNGVKVNAEDQRLRKAIRTGKPIPGYEAQI